MAKNRKKYKTYTISFRVPEKLYLELLEYSDKEGAPISEIIRDAIKVYLKKKVLRINFLDFVLSLPVVVLGNIIIGDNNIIGNNNAITLNR
jgi:predicted DNA-binding protein